MRKTTQIGLFVCIAAAAAAAGAWLQGRSLDDGAKQLVVTKTEPNMEPLRQAAWPDLQGKVRKLADWQGKVLVVNFWAAWCAPCREEIPEFVRVQKELSSKGVQFIGMAVEPLDRTKQVREFVREMRVSYPNLMSDYAALTLAQDAGNPSGALPFTVILDREGKLRGAHLGRLSELKLREMIRELL